MTLNQRRQALDFGKIRGTGIHIPSGMIGVGARAHILNLYYEVPVVISTVFWRNKNLIGSLWSSKSSPSSTWSKKTSPQTGWVGKTPPPDGSTQTI